MVERFKRRRTKRRLSRAKLNRTPLPHSCSTCCVLVSIRRSTRSAFCSVGLRTFQTFLSGRTAQHDPAKKPQSRLLSYRVSRRGSSVRTDAWNHSITQGATSRLMAGARPRRTSLGFLTPSCSKIAPEVALFSFRAMRSRGQRCVTNRSLRILFWTDQRKGG